MAEWGYWEWIAYSLIAVAAIMPAISLAVSAEEPLASSFAKKVVQSRWWRLVPAAAIVLSALVFIAVRLGLVSHSEPQQTRVVTKTVVQRIKIPIPDPAQAQQIKVLQNEIDGPGGYRVQIADLKAELRHRPRTVSAKIATPMVVPIVQDGSQEHPFDDRRKCPPGYTVIDTAEFSDHTVGIRMPEGAPVCFVNLKLYHNQTGVEVT